jgi:type VI secretion system Hcp family effector
MSYLRNLIVTVGTLLTTSLLFGDFTTSQAAGDPVDDYTVLKVQAPAVIPERIFLKLGDMKGFATTSAFVGQIVAHSLSYGITQAGEWEEGDRLSGRITRFGDFKLVRQFDAVSPALAQACATKQPFGEAVITVSPDGRSTFMKITLQGVIVSSVAVEHQTQSWPRPMETITLRYMKAIWEVGTAKSGYDLGQNAKI